jgi:sigma-B regulation protein RsbU (phosphoserine phosphatase)
MADSMPILQITSPTGQTARQDLDRPTMIIGRLPECDIQLDSPRVSRRHAELVREEDGGWLIRDLQSRNHTRVNGEVIEERRLEVDDLIEVGHFQLRILPVDAEPRDARTTSWAPDEGQSTDFRTLRSSPAPRLNASHLAKVNGLGARLVEIGNLSERLAELCRTLVGPDMSCESAVVLRVDRLSEADPQLLCTYQLRHAHAKPPGISRPVVEAAIAGQQPVLAGGAISSGLTVSFSAADRGVTAIIACPLRIEKAFADMLYATVPHDCGTLDWLALATLASEQYKKAELQIEARKSTQDNATMQHELNRARKIQMSLVPKSPAAAGLEVAIGFEPCLWIGGDYANVLTAPDGRVILIVADVSGKGLPAAMLATGVHSIVDAAVSGGESLRQIAERLNHFFINSMDRQSHLTVLAVLFNPQTGQAEYLNAGHPPVLVVSPDGTVRDLKFGHNPPLGILPTSPEIEPAELGAGELLFLYTDGLSEMYDGEGKMIGIDGVKSIIGTLYGGEHSISLPQLRDRISAKLDEVRGSSQITDDRTFLLARRL